MILSDTAIKNRTTVGVLSVLIVIGGLYSYLTLPREAAPDVPIPYILVTTTYEGVSPEDIESSVTMKIEKKLAGIKGVKEIRSTSMEGESLLVIEFFPDVRIEDALQYVRDKVDQAKADLPTDAEDPVIREINIAEFPIMFVNISGTYLAGAPQGHRRRPAGRHRGGARRAEVRRAGRRWSGRSAWRSTRTAWPPTG